MHMLGICLLEYQQTWINLLEFDVLMQLSWTFEREGTKLEWRWKCQPSSNSKQSTALILDFLMDSNIRLSVRLFLNLLYFMTNNICCIKMMLHCFHDTLASFIDEWAGFTSSFIVFFNWQRLYMAFIVVVC